MIDGTRAPRFDADVGIRDGRIAAIGALDGRTAARTLDATGRIVAPGFIDSHTHDDQALLSQPDMSFKVSQGVTTVIAGNCGISIAPLAAPTSPLPSPLDLLDASARARFPSFADYFAELARTPAGGQRRRPGRPFDPARADDGVARPRRRAGGDRGHAGAARRGARSRRDRAFHRHVLPAGGEGDDRGDHRGRPAADRQRRPLRDPHARRGRPGDGGARRDLPDRPRARRRRRRLAPQGAERRRTSAARR